MAVFYIFPANQPWANCFLYPPAMGKQPKKINRGRAAGISHSRRNPRAPGLIEQRQTFGLSGSDGFYQTVQPQPGSLMDTSTPGGLGPHTDKTQCRIYREIRRRRVSSYHGRFWFSCERQCWFGVQAFDLSLESLAFPHPLSNWKWGWG